MDPLEKESMNDNKESNNKDSKAKSIMIDGIAALEEHCKDRQFVTALARGLEVLRSFEPGDRHLGNQDIAERSGLPKPTVSRQTYTLSRMGFLHHDK